MKVMFCEPYAKNQPHFERCLELIQVHLDRGDEVFFIGCDGKLSTCDINLFHFSPICKTCTQRCDKGISLLSEKVTTNYCTKISAAQEIEIKNYVKNQKISDIEDLKVLDFDGFDVGMGVASSVISHLRNPNFDFKRYRNLINKYLESSLKIYLSLQNYIEKEKFDLMYVFNGRFAHLRPTIRLAEKFGIDYYTHEVGATVDRYSLFKNMLPHNVNGQTKMIKELWENADKDKRAEMGASFYTDQVSGKVLDQIYNFTKKQKENTLPANWDDSKNNIVIFNSSEDEYAAIGSKYSTGVYPLQLDGIRAIVDSLRDVKGTHLYLRMHPNLKTANKKIIDDLYEIKAPNFTILAPEDPTSTYSLIDKSTIVVVFNSTVGIEAVFKGKPVVLLRNSLYSGLSGTYKPTTHEETIAFLKKGKDLLPLDKEGALMYGYFRKYNGIPYQYYEAESLFKGNFKGVNLNDACTAPLVVKFFEKLQWVKKSYL